MQMLVGKQQPKIRGPYLSIYLIKMQLDYTCPTLQAECGWGKEVDSVCGSHRRNPTIGSQVKFEIDGFYLGKELHGIGGHELCCATILEGLGRHNFLEMEAIIINRHYKSDGGCPKWAKYYQLSTEYKSKQYHVICLFVSHNQIAILNTKLLVSNKSGAEVVPTSLHYITGYALTGFAKWDDAGTEVVRQPISYITKAPHHL